MLALQSKSVRLEIGTDPYREIIHVRSGLDWKPLLQTISYATEISDHRKYNIYFRECALLGIDLPETAGEGCVRVRLEHEDYFLTRTIRLDEEENLHFDVELTAKKDLLWRAAEDKWEFLEEKHHIDTVRQGPLDFVWSQRLKMLPGCFVSHYNFRTPVQIFQQNGYCAAMIAGLEQETEERLEKFPLGFDMNVTEDLLPWMSYGFICAVHMMPNWPGEAGHSMIIRGSSEEYLKIRIAKGETADYHYTIKAFYQEGTVGYQSVLRYVWKRYYHYRKLKDYGDPTENERYPGVCTFDEWENALYEHKLTNEYFVDENNPSCGGVRCFRQGDWFSRTDYRHDVWYACWLQELVTGYGMYLYGKEKREALEKGGQETGNGVHFCRMAEQILNFILSAPRQKDGLFPVICYVEEDGSRTWLNDDGWAGYYTDYHAMMMSWNGYLMLKWGELLFPERQEEILDFLLPYAGFLLTVQQESGNIPAWYGEDGKPSRDQFRDFNAETAVSAAFLMELGDVTGRAEFTDAGQKALAFVDREVRPRQRWFDMETFKSCSQKAYAFYDSITAQYPQCNLSMMYAVIAYEKQFELFPTSKNRKKLCEVMDYLLLYQQLWNHPSVCCDVFGGFTVQNGDNEWSDIREGIIAILLFRMYEITGDWEYMERGITAMQSCFPPLPYENWAHCGYESMQYDSSLLWGGGVAMTAGEFYKKEIGDAAFDAETGQGTAFFGTYAPEIREEGNRLFITADENLRLREIRIFHVTDDREILINGESAGCFTGKDLQGKITVYEKDQSIISG